MKNKILMTSIILLVILFALSPVLAGGQMGIPIIVDYDKTIFELISEARFNEKNLPNGNIEDYFQNETDPGIGTAEVNIKFILFGTISSKDVLERIKKMGYRPATPKEILTFAFKKPEYQRFFTLVTANPNWKGCRCPHYMVILSGDPETRALSIKMFGYEEYPENYRWAVVPLK